MVKFVVSLRPLCLGAVAFLLCLLVDPLMAQKDGRPTAVAGPISIDAKVRSLTAVLGEIAAQSGARFAAFIADPEPVVTLRVAAGTVREALEQVAAGANEQVEETRRGVLLLSSSEDAPWKRGPDVLIVWELLRHLSDKQRAELLSGGTLPLSEVPVEAEPRVLDWILRDLEFGRAALRDRRRAYVCLSYTPRVILRGEGGRSLGWRARIDIGETQRNFAQHQMRTLEKKYLEDPTWPLSKPIPVPAGPIRPPQTDETDAAETDVRPPPGVDAPATRQHARQLRAKDVPIARAPASPSLSLPQTATRMLEEWCRLITELTGQPLVVDLKSSRNEVFISAGDYTRSDLIGILTKCTGVRARGLAGEATLLARQQRALNPPGPVSADQAREEILEMLHPVLSSCEVVPAQPFQNEPPQRRRNLTTRYSGYPEGKKIADLGPFSGEEILSRTRCSLEELPAEQRTWVVAAIRHSGARDVLPKVREVELVPGFAFTVYLGDPGATVKKFGHGVEIATLRERYPYSLIYSGSGQAQVIDGPPTAMVFRVHWR